MSNARISRRALLGAGAATAATAVVGSEALAADDPPGRPEPSERFVGAVTEALPTSAVGEDMIFITPGALVANSINTTTAAWNIYDAGLSGSRPGGTTAVLSASVNVPLGATITGIDFVIAGSAHSGGVDFYRYLAETPGDATSVYSANFTTGSGIVVYSSPALLQVFDGTQTFEAYFFVNGVTTCVCKGIRVRYLRKGYFPITPARVYDSRLSMTPDANGALTSGGNRTVSVARARDVATGALLSQVVPAGATSVVFTLTATNTVGGGFLAVNPGGTTAVSASTINWPGSNATIANTSIVQLGGSTQLTVVHGGPGSTDFILDVVGYFV